MYIIDIMDYRRLGLDYEKQDYEKPDWVIEGNARELVALLSAEERETQFIARWRAIGIELNGPLSLISSRNILSDHGGESEIITQGVQYKVYQKISSVKSLGTEALRAYERTSMLQEKAAGRLLTLENLFVLWKVSVLSTRNKFLLVNKLPSHLRTLQLFIVQLPKSVEDVNQVA